MTDPNSSFIPEPSALKKSWQMVKFGEIAKQCKESVDRDNNPFERYVTGGDMDSECLRINRWGTFGEDYVGPAFHRIFRKGQILYGSRRTYLKKVAVADFDGITANTTFVIEPKNKNKLLPELLPFIMLSDIFTNHSVKNSKGSTNPYINWSDIANFEFPLPPLERQKEITEVFNKIQHTLYSSIRVQKISRVLLTSVISDHIVKIKKAGACLMPLSALGDWKGGGTPSKSNKSFWTGGSIPWVSPKDMHTGKLSCTIDKITNKAVQNSSTNLLPADSILFVTRSGILRHTLPIAIIDVPMTINQDIKALSVKEPYNPFYIWIVLQFYAPKILQDCSKVGTTVESIDSNALKNFELPIPERHIQDQIEEVWQNQNRLFNTLEQKKQSIESINTQTFFEFFKGGVP